MLLKDATAEQMFDELATRLVTDKTLEIGPAVILLTSNDGQTASYMLQGPGETCVSMLLDLIKTKIPPQILLPLLLGSGVQVEVEEEDGSITREEQGSYSDP